MNLDSLPYRSHVENVNKSLEDSVREALALAGQTSSLRALARETGVSGRLLALIVAGERTTSPATVRKLAAALERIADRNAEAARILRHALNEEEK